MENSISVGCSKLLTRVKESNLRSTFKPNQNQEMRERKLKSLSNYRKRINEGILSRNLNHKKHSSLQKQKRNIEELAQVPAKQIEKLLLQISENCCEEINQRSELQQLEFNFKRESDQQTKPYNFYEKSNIIRNPFSNISNFQKTKSKLFPKNKKPLILNNKRKNDEQNIEQALLIQPINTKSLKHHLKNNDEIKYQSFGFDQNQEYFYQQTTKITNEIFDYFIHKLNEKNEQIGQIGQITFKMICFFIIAILIQKQIIIKKDDIINFVETGFLEQLNSEDTKREQIRRNSLANDGSLKKNLFQNRKVLFQQITEKKRVNDKKVEIISLNKMIDEQEPKTLQTLKNSILKKTELDYKKLLKKQNNTSKSNSKRNLVSIVAIEQDKKLEYSNSLKKSRDKKTIGNQSKQQQSLRNEADILQQDLFNPRKLSNQKSKTNFTFESKNLNSTKKGQKEQSADKKFKSMSKFQQVSNNSPLNGQSKVKTHYKLLQLESQINLQINRDPKLKLSLNLHTVNDFLNEDGLMTKRKKYLELHQGILNMNQQQGKLRRSIRQLNENIFFKQDQLTDLEEKLYQIKNKIQKFEHRYKEAEQFLNGPECPQMVQKIIKNKKQLQKNLKNVINYNAWYSSNLAQSSHLHNIISTKQNSLDQLNVITRKMRSCKEIQQIQSLVLQFRQFFLITIEKYSQIINEFQDKIKQAEMSRSNMLKNLEDWQVENKIKQKIVTNSFIDYYSIERKVQLCILNIPVSISQIESGVDRLLSFNNDGKQNPVIQKRCSFQTIEKDLKNIFKKMRKQNQIVTNQLYKQKRFAMILQKIS